MHYHLMLPLGATSDPSGYYLYWSKQDAEATLALHKLCCYKGHQVIECMHPLCVLRLFEQ